MIFKINIFINKLCGFFFLRKKYLLRIFQIKNFLLKKSTFLVYNKLIERNKSIVNILFLLYNKRYNSIIKDFDNFSSFNLNIKYKSNDATLLY